LKPLDTPLMFHKIELFESYFVCSINMVKVIDLSGPEGNAYYLLGMVTSLGLALNLSNKQIQVIKDEMKAGDYDNLLAVFQKNFGSLVELRRDGGKII